MSAQATRQAGAPWVIRLDRCARSISSAGVALGSTSAMGRMRLIVRAVAAPLDRLDIGA